jgi:hypothetical protein
VKQRAYDCVICAVAAAIAIDLMGNAAPANGRANSVRFKVRPGGGLVNLDSPVEFRYV